MEGTPPQKREEEEEETHNLKLRRQFQHLQNDWDSFKRSKSRTRRRRSAGCFPVATPPSKILSTLRLMDQSSPRHLMSSLQNRGLTPDSWDEVGGWRVRTNDLAVEEIRNERRDVMESGKLKGRRLNLEDSEDEVDDGNDDDYYGDDGLMDEEILSFNDWDGDEITDENGEVGSAVLNPHVSEFDGKFAHDHMGGRYDSECCSCSSSSLSSSSSSSSSEEQVTVKPGRKVGWKFLLVLLAVGWIFWVIMGICLSSSQEGENEVTLVPT